MKQIRGDCATDEEGVQRLNEASADLRTAVRKESIVKPHQRMYLSARHLPYHKAIVSAAVTAYMLALRPERSAQRRGYEFPPLATAMSVK